MSKYTYKDAGVDLELNQIAMKKLPPLMQRTHTSRVMEMTGGFAGLFRLNKDAPRNGNKLSRPGAGIGNRWRGDKNQSGDSGKEIRYHRYRFGGDVC